MVFLDSNHTHDHVLKELELYSPFVTEGSYLVLPDTFIEYFPKGGMRVEMTAGGGRKFTSTASEGEYSMVVIDEDTTFYLAAGESVTFGSDGMVLSHNGVVHVYSPLSRSAFYYDPVRDPAGSSFTGSAVK